MLIVVASGNIFRRELTSYILGEAGYRVSEARDAATLLGTLFTSAPVGLIVDVQLQGDGPEATLEAIRQRSAIPLLWIAEDEQATGLLAADKHPADYLAWPYHPETMLVRFAALLARAESAAAADGQSQRYAGLTE
jgi:DNA-binding response OmpR family regulator